MQFRINSSGPRDQAILAQTRSGHRQIGLTHTIRISLPRTKELIPLRCPSACIDDVTLLLPYWSFSQSRRKLLRDRRVVPSNHPRGSPTLHTRFLEDPFRKATRRASDGNRLVNHHWYTIQRFCSTWSITSSWNLYIE